MTGARSASPRRSRVLTGMLFGLAPALHMAKTDLMAALREGGRGNAIGFRRNRLRSVLVVGEVALALVLLSGAGLLMRSFYHLQSMDPGFDPHGLLTFRTNLPGREVQDRRTAGRLLPACAGSHTRTARRHRGRRRADLPAGRRRLHPLFHPNRQAAGAGGQSTQRRLLRRHARLFQRPAHSHQSTAATSPNTTTPPRRPVAIISETMARQFYRQRESARPANSDGQRIQAGRDCRHRRRCARPGTGVQRTCRRVRARGADAVQLDVFRRAHRRRSRRPHSGVRAVIRELDPELPLDAVGTVDALVSTSLSQRRFSMLLMAIFAGLALILAMVGHLRRDRVFGDAGDPGNRHPHGARRAARRRAAPWCSATRAC